MKRKEKNKEVQFYANKEKYLRAKAMVKAGKAKKVHDAYVSIGGPFSFGHGYMPVEKK